MTQQSTTRTCVIKFNEGLYFLESLMPPYYRVRTAELAGGLTPIHCNPRLILHERGEVNNLAR